MLYICKERELEAHVGLACFQLSLRTTVLRVQLKQAARKVCKGMVIVAEKANKHMGQQKPQKPHP